MTRLAPAFAPDITTLSPTRAPLFDLEISVVTPLFGGGPVAREVDAARPVSGKSVRGQLRFWWRACRGAKFQTVQELFDAEEAIWGSVNVPSAVDVRVEMMSPGTEVAPYFYEMRRDGSEKNFPTVRAGYPGYALFPFQGNKEKRVPINEGREGFQFSLKIDVARHANATAIEEEVAAALWAWLLFGGVGSRTRRGCGSLYCKNESGFQYHPATIDAAARQHITQGARRLPIPVLSRAHMLTLATTDTPTRAWMEAISGFQAFRQGKEVGRRKGSDPQVPSKLGRSYWPEPDSIRSGMTPKWAKHQPEHRAIPYYPRADLGLPIIFQFQDAARIGDPDVTTLNAHGGQASRMASPLILKSLNLTADTATPVALMLNAPHVWEKGMPSIEVNNRIEPLRPDELCNPAKSREVKPMLQCDTAREAFLEHLRNTWNGYEVRETIL